MKRSREAKGDSTEFEVFYTEKILTFSSELKMFLKIERQI